MGPALQRLRSGLASLLISSIFAPVDRRNHSPCPRRPISSCRWPSRTSLCSTFDAADKGANVLSRPVLEELERHLNELEKKKDLKGLILDSAKPGIFIFGADVREFLAAKTISREQKVELSTRGRKLFQRLSHFPCVTVAAIDGGCFGGGAEMSMWCDRRIMSTSPKAQMGFPEVKLGIYPGWGGTARCCWLARPVECRGNGVSSGENVDAKTAFKMGLVSDVVASEKLREAAIHLIRAENKSQQYLEDRKRWDGPIPMSETELNFLGVTANALYPAADEGAISGPYRGLGSDDRLGRRRYRSGLQMPRPRVLPTSSARRSIARC